MIKEQLALATKSSTSLVSPLERRVARGVVPRLPRWLGTHHLTMLTLLWAALAVLFGYLAAGDLRWMWATSAVIFLQYLTDFFDGKVGKHRGTGLVKWGFYMDHLLDYVFLCALLAGYSFILPARSQWHLLLVLAVFGGFMVNSFLAFSATGRFRISHLGLGPTEFRIALCVLNALMVFDGPRRMAKALPFIAAGGLVALCVLAFRTQRQLWRLDMEQKRLDTENKLRAAAPAAAAPGSLAPRREAA